MWASLRPAGLTVHTEIDPHHIINTLNIKMTDRIHHFYVFLRRYMKVQIPRQHHILTFFQSFHIICLGGQTVWSVRVKLAPPSAGVKYWRPQGRQNDAEIRTVKHTSLYGSGYILFRVRFEWIEIKSFMHSKVAAFWIVLVKTCDLKLYEGMRLWWRVGNKHYLMVLTLSLFHRAALDILVSFSGTTLYIMFLLFFWFRHSFLKRSHFKIKTFVCC